MEKEEKQVSDDIRKDEISARAKALVKSIVQIENEPEDDEDDSTVARLLTDAFLKWDTEHPGENADFLVEREDDDGELRVVITPKD